MAENTTRSAVIKDKLGNLSSDLINKIDQTVQSIGSRKPTEETPINYKVTHRGGALVRSGYETNTSQVHQLSAGEVVTVVELIGRRCRIVTPIDGWVSVETKDGIQIMKQCTIQKKAAQNEAFEQRFEKKFSKIKEKQSAATQDPRVERGQSRSSSPDEDRRRRRKDREYSSGSDRERRPRDRDRGRRDRDSIDRDDDRYRSSKESRDDKRPVDSSKGAKSAGGQLPSMKLAPESSGSGGGGSSIVPKLSAPGEQQGGPAFSGAPATSGTSAALPTPGAGASLDLLDMGTSESSNGAAPAPGPFDPFGTMGSVAPQQPALATSGTGGMPSGGYPSVGGAEWSGFQSVQSGQGTTGGVGWSDGGGSGMPGVPQPQGMMQTGMSAQQGAWQAFGQQPVAGPSPNMGWNSGMQTGQQAQAAMTSQQGAWPAFGQQPLAGPSLNSGWNAGSQAGQQAQAQQAATPQQGAWPAFGQQSLVGPSLNSGWSAGSQTGQQAQPQQAATTQQGAWPASGQQLPAGPNLNSGWNAGSQAGQQAQVQQTATTQQGAWPASGQQPPAGSSWNSGWNAGSVAGQQAQASLQYQAPAGSQSAADELLNRTMQGVSNLGLEHRATIAPAPSSLAPLSLPVSGTPMDMLKGLSR